MTQRPQAALHLTIWGDGEPIVLVHGGLISGDPTDEVWAAQRPLADRVCWR